MTLNRRIADYHELASLTEQTMRMKRLIYLSLAALMVLAAASCKKESRHEKDYRYDLHTGGGVTELTDVSAVLWGGIDYYYLRGSDKVVFANRDKFEFDEVGFYLSKTEDVDPSISVRLVSDGEGNRDFPSEFSVKATGLEPETVYYYKAFLKRFGEESYGIIQSFKTDKTPALVESLVVTPVSATLKIDETVHLIVQIFPYDATNPTLKWTSSRPEVASVSEEGFIDAQQHLLCDGLVKALTPGESIISVQTLDGSNITKTCTVTVKKPAGGVDMGLSVNWAPCNLGAETPEDYGDYYAWGEIIPYYSEGHSQDKNCTSWRIREDHPITEYGYDWTSYKWCNGTFDTITKYCTSKNYGTVDNITELQRGENAGETDDDAAHANLAGEWRMPTKDEWTALREQCDWQWKTTSDGYSHNGFLVTSTKTGNSIFLPAAGNWIGTKLDWDGTYIYYWSSSLDIRPHSAVCIYGTYNVSVKIGYKDRRFGMPIRPVCDK